jgi:hypothetical protein
VEGAGLSGGGRSTPFFGDEHGVRAGEGCAVRLIQSMYDTQWRSAFERLVHGPSEDWSADGRPVDPDDHRTRCAARIHHHPPFLSSHGLEPDLKVTSAVRLASGGRSTPLARD